MDDVDKMLEFITDKVCFNGNQQGCGMYVESFNLQELRQLRDLVQAALIQRLCESAPLVYREIFQEREKL